MTSYLISQDGEPVALVSDINMARAIIQCQPWGDYLVETVDMGDTVQVEPPTRAPGRSSDQRPAGGRRRAQDRPVRWTHGIPAAAVYRARHQMH